MKISEKDYKYRTDYIAEKYTRLPISYPNDFANEVKKACELKGLSLAAYIRQAIEAQMEADGFQQQSAATKYIKDEDGNRIMVEITYNGTTVKKVEGGWINTKTEVVYKSLKDARKSTEEPKE